MLGAILYYIATWHDYRILKVKSRLHISITLYYIIWPRWLLRTETVRSYFRSMDSFNLLDMKIPYNLEYNYFTNLEYNIATAL